MVLDVEQTAESQASRGVNDETGGEEVIDWGFLEMAAVAGYHFMIRAAGTDVEARQEGKAMALCVHSP
jgi:hypothetical protein